MSKSYYSNAEWPTDQECPDHGFTPQQFSEDVHSHCETDQENWNYAASIASRLSMEGLGGRRHILPIRTWVSEEPNGPEVERPLSEAERLRDEALLSMKTMQSTSSVSGWSYRTPTTKKQHQKSKKRRTMSNASKKRNN